MKGIFLTLSSILVLKLAFGWIQPEKASLPLGKKEGYVLLELFTSQGCSSCPSADKLLEKTVQNAQAKGQKVIALSFHVDYWNRLGWKDPYSNLAFTKRQQQYSAWIPNASVYTPQLVANGKSEFVGSDVNRLNQVLTNELDMDSGITIAIGSPAIKNGKLTGEINISNLPAGQELNLALVSKHTENFIPRGENEGITLKGANVVRTFVQIPNPQSKSSFSLDFPSDLNKANALVVAFLQDKKTHKVLGINQLGLE